MKVFFRSLIRRAVESFPIDGEKKGRLLKTLLRISRKQGADGFEGDKGMMELDLGEIRD